jgi:hypothetical protein
VIIVDVIREIGIEIAAMLIVMQCGKFMARTTRSKKKKAE